MAQDSDVHGGSHGPSLPHRSATASLWPVIVAIAVLILGLALFWAASEDNQDATIPVVAGAAALVVVAAAAWAYEEGVLARTMRAERATESLDARYTQVVAFAIHEGQLEAARAPEGILHTLEHAEGGLRDHPGFEDLRVSVAPAQSGSSQALVETVWASRADFAGYDAAKGTVLDLITAAGEQVVPGSVQAFDMDVVRDTKESPIRFTLAHGVLALCALVVGGFAVGIVAGIVDEGGTVAAGEDGEDEDPYLILATDNAFDKAVLVAPPNTEVTFTMVNNGAVLHNLAFYNSKEDADDGIALSEGSIGAFTEGGATDLVTFTTPGPGTYYFQCDLHPTEMVGTFEVREGGPGGGGGGPPTVVATDNAYDISTLEATAGEEYSVTFENQGEILHNLAFLREEGGEPLADGAVGDFVGGGESYVLTFTPPEPGEFVFICEIHPSEMFGTFTVR